jgi:cellulose synthase/poly-beta-1,6-N-acetylglucosamine synthase-like glycosyltransferase
MGSKILEGLKWLDAHPLWVLSGGLAIIAVINWKRWTKDKVAAQRVKEDNLQIHKIRNAPKVSFLIPAWNEAGRIRPCLESIHALRYPNKEIVVCAGGKDDSYEIARQIVTTDGVTLEQYEGEGKQKALRRCFEKSTGEIIFLTDADCLLDDKCVEGTLHPILIGGEQVVTGCWQPFEKSEKNAFVRYQWANHLRYQSGLEKWVKNLDGRNCALTRTVLIKTGALQKEAPIGTDYVLSREVKKHGYRIRAVTESRVHTEYPLSMKDYLRQGSRWFRNRLVHGVRYQEWKDVSACLWSGMSSFFLLTGFLSFVLRQISVGILWIIALSNLALSQLRLRRFFELTGKHNPRNTNRFFDFLKYAMISNLAMLKGLSDSILLKNRNNW